jgi:hypothetical protein
MLAAFLSVCASFEAQAQKPGDTPPPDIQARVKALVPELERAMAARDEKAIYAAVEKVRKAYGPFAGIPESPERYATPVKTDEPPVDVLVAAWDGLFQGMLAKRGCKSEIAQKNQMELRESAFIAIGCLAMADAGAPNAEAYETRAHEELDYLVARQAESGLFPFPAYPAQSAPNLVAMAERMRREHPEAVQNGFFVLDRDGGGQFDTGCCAYALIQGHRAFGDERYLAAARKAADWALACPVATNWNYNSFSVWQLSALYDVTKDRKYLDAAVDKAVFGVLPGLMDNGRWVDPHNAKQSYHFIMVRGLNELLRVLPEDHPRYAEIREKTIRSVDSRANDILRDGVSNSESALVGLSLVLQDLEKKPLWRDAANAIVNALRDAKKPDPISLPLYIRFRGTAGGGTHE